MAIRIDLAQLGFPYHTTYAGPRLTCVNLHSDPPKHEPVCATREHTTPPPCATPSRFTRCVHATLTISHAQYTVVFSHNGIAEILGLPEYVASTAKSRPHIGLQQYGPQSTQAGRCTTGYPCPPTHQRHISCFVSGHYLYPVRRHNHVPPLSQFRYLTLSGYSHELLAELSRSR
jgi:hypothetical protein